MVFFWRGGGVPTYDAKLLQQLDRLFTGAPRWRRPAPRLLPHQVRQHFYALLQHVALLLLAQRRDELMRIPMQADLMPLFYNLADLVGKRFRRVSGREPRGFDIVLVPELQEAIDADGGAEDAAGDVGGVRGFAVARVDPVD